MEKIEEGVYRLGTKWVNFFLVEEGGALTLVDAGLPGYASQVTSALQELGRKASDVKAIVLTHTHSDHIGGARQLARETGAPVLVHRGEVPIAVGERKPVPPKGFLRGILRPQALAFIGHVIAAKGLQVVTVKEATPYESDDVLDVPGKLRVVYTPGHSSAHCALLLEDRRVLFCGDAMATLSAYSGATGPMVHPFNENKAQAVTSLEILERVDADFLLPGHGEPWRGRMSDAVSEARRRI